MRANNDFFLDYVNSYTANIYTAEKVLGLITAFSTLIDRECFPRKCSQVILERGK